MPQEVKHPEWRKSHETTKYPFAEKATLANSAGKLVLEGMLLDASLHVIGAGARLYMSSVVVTHRDITINVGDPGEEVLASGTFDLLDPPGLVKMADIHGRPAGILISEPERLAIFRSWGVGTHTFRNEQTEFAATVAIPTPEVGVRGFILDNGDVVTGDVWLVGDDGVILREETRTLPGVNGGPPRTIRGIRIDVVGDPLFRRRLCQNTDLFTTPNPIRRIRFKQSGLEFECVPDAAGDIQIVPNNFAAVDTVLRITPRPEGVYFGAEGSPQAG